MEEEQKVEETSNKNRMYLIIGVVVVAVILLIILISSPISDSKSKTGSDAEVSGSEVSKTEEINNTTDLSSLKTSEYTNSSFEEVEIGDSYSEVEEAMGTLESVETDSEYDVYSTTMDETQYVFYFDGDKLAEVSVFVV